MKSIAAVVERSDGLVATVVTDVGVALGRAHVGVPSQILDHLDRHLALGEQRAECVPGPA
jgi:hypothetical protein